MHPTSQKLVRLPCVSISACVLLAASALAPRAQAQQEIPPMATPAPPPLAPTSRPSIGLALGGGGALALCEVGVLQWLEEHRIPVDMVAGTSMGGLIGALYATGHSIPEMQNDMTPAVFDSVFRLQTSYTSRSFRRREDSRDLPNGITAGLRHGVSLRNGILIDQGLNSFLNSEFVRYDDQTDFNTLPIPFRVLATDLNDARPVTFTRGSLADAVRASISIPGVYPPFTLHGHAFVDGGVLDNLPTATLRDMHASVIVAVSLPEPALGRDDLNSVLGVIQRSFSVAIEANERISRKLANVLIMPDLTGFTASDYARASELAQRGYQAAEQHKTELLRYALYDAGWQRYLAERTSRERGPAGTVLHVRVHAPNPSVTRAVEQLFAPLIDQPLHSSQVDKLLANITADGRYQANWSLAFETEPERRPVLVVTVEEKRDGPPPFLLLGGNLQAQTGGGLTRATVEGILIDQDLGGFGSELRSHILLGSLTQLDTEYFRRLPGQHKPLGGLFVAPRAGIFREAFPIYTDKVLTSERELQRAGAGIDLGWGDGHTTELRAGWEFNSIQWSQRIGTDYQPNIAGTQQQAGARFVFDSQDRALVPQYGARFTASAGYLFSAAASENAPRFTAQWSLAHTLSKQVFVLAGSAGTMLNRNVGQPYLFTLGGPLHLSASGTDEYRGTDYFLVQPALLRKIFSLPAVLGQNIYAGAVYEAGQMRAPNQPTVTRQDVFFGLVGETPLGVITLGPAIGDAGRYKLVFTLGRLF